MLGCWERHDECVTGGDVPEAREEQLERPGASDLASDEDLSPREKLLREDLAKEYYAILGVVSDYDARFISIKGWSVTLSLASLGLGFQQKHYALFALGALSAAAFWLIEIITKRHQLRYYARMRDIEVAAYQLNHLDPGALGQVSAPRIDSAWGFSGRKSKDDQGVRRVIDLRLGPLPRRDESNVRKLRRKAYYMPYVLLPHLVAMVLGVGLYVAALRGSFTGLKP
jgi:hypothetical protein